MLEQLFGSKTRVKLLQLFLNNSDKSYYLRQLARQLKSQLNSVRREVNNLEKLKIIVSFGKTKLKKYFQVNSQFILYPELKALLLKAQLLLEESFVKQMKKCGRVYFLALTGFFIGIDDWPTDMLLVGKINKKKLNRLMKKFEKQLNHDIKYTIMTPAEFKYRQDITDRFLYDILEGRKAVIVDKLK